MNTIRLPATFALIACTVAADCPTSATVVCPDIAQQSLVVAVTDARTSAPIANGATVVVVSAVVRDSLVLMRDDQQYIAYNSDVGPGLYTVTVRKSGYADYVNNNVTITRHGCDINKVTLNAPLAVR